MGGVLFSRSPARSEARQEDGDVERTVDAAPGSRADSEIDQFIARRHAQRESGAEDQFGQLLVDLPDYDAEWMRFRQQCERKQQTSLLKQWREHHMRQARSLSRALSSMIRFHLEQVQRLDGKG
jgi:hypothetical protein